MSKVIREIEGRELCHHVQTNNGRIYLVDSADTLDRGYETMVFPCSGQGHVTSWTDEYVEHYCTYGAMEKRHEYLINNLEEVL